MVRLRIVWVVLLLSLLQRVARVANRYAVTGMLRGELSTILQRFFGGRDCFFVQIGAANGEDTLGNLVAANPLWRGLFIEPQAGFFDELVRKYDEGTRFRFEQVAISRTAGRRPFYTVSPEAGLPTSVNMVGSLSREHVLRALNKVRKIYNFPKPADEYICETQTRCEPLMSVLRENEVAGIDLFQVDAEGCDLEILEQLDFSVFTPTVIVYEHVSLGSGEIAANNLLRANGYRVLKCSQLDTIAVRLRHTR